MAVLNSYDIDYVTSETSCARVEDTICCAVGSLVGKELVHSACHFLSYKYSHFEQFQDTKMICLNLELGRDAKNCFSHSSMTCSCMTPSWIQFSLTLVIF